MKTLTLDYNIIGNNKNLTSHSLKDNFGLLNKEKMRFKERQFNEYSSMHPKDKYEQMCVHVNESENDKISLSTKMNKSAKMNFGGFLNSKLLHKYLAYASDNGAFLAAAYTAITSTLFRPVAILALPNVEKKNKQYACTKSIASSLIGCGLMYLVAKPIDTALKKVHANPAKYLKNATISRLRDTGKTLKESSKYLLATKTFTLGSDLFCVIPKGILTVALIPPIMALFFKHKVNNDSLKEINSAIPVQFKGNYKQDKKACKIFKDFIGEDK